MQSMKSISCKSEEKTAFEKLIFRTMEFLERWINNAGEYIENSAGRIAYIHKYVSTFSIRSSDVKIERRALCM